jgi:phage-related protein (TIGR01555 family)
MLKWLLGKTEVQKEPEQPKPRKSIFSTHEFDLLDPDRIRNAVADKIDALQRKQPAFYGKFAMDNSSNGIANFKTYANGINTVSDAVVGWYATQGFIGAQLCGIIAQNWLVNKACAMPADDAIRKGYSIVTTDGDELDPEAVKILKSYDKSLKLEWHMREFIRKGRIFGVRIAMFKVISTDPDYYEKPFNIDGVTPGSYKGIVQVDPYWTAPMLDGASASQPDTLHFYEPTWWIINGKKVHRSHLIIFRHAEPVDVLKPQYIYGGVPLTQQIMERVYAAERTSNEAPQLAMSKRTTVWLTDMEAVMANTNDAIGRLQTWSQFRDNYGIKIGDKEGDEFNQFDTSLADFDALIMTQYQLVAAIAGVPATKLLGTSPKGFNATGEYEEASYHELLESLQSRDLTPLAERHHMLVIKAYVEPQLHKKMDIETTLNWLPLDTPTAKELADTNLVKAQTGQTLITSGALSSEDERQRIATDKQSGYNEMGLEDQDMPDKGEELADEDLLDTQDGDFQDPEDGSEPVGKMLQVTQDKDPCWTGYKQIGMKDKNGKQVPNCVPTGQDAKEQIGNRKSRKAKRFK